MSKTNVCGIIQDLLPLYVDGVCSEDSKKLIEDHVKTCDLCHAAQEKMTEKVCETSLQNETKTVMFWYRRKVYGVIAWVLGIALAVFSFLFSFPVLLFTFYPYSPIGILTYVGAVATTSILTVIKKNKALKAVLIVLLSIPVIALLFVLISIGTGG